MSIVALDRMFWFRHLFQFFYVQKFASHELLVMSQTNSFDVSFSSFSKSKTAQTNIAISQQCSNSETMISQKY